MRELVALRALGGDLVGDPLDPLPLPSEELRSLCLSIVDIHLFTDVVGEFVPASCTSSLCRALYAPCADRRENGANENMLFNADFFLIGCS
jgi:hypothetical protein